MKRHVEPADDRSSGFPEAAAADVGICDVRNSG
jgi:hypothetical protein